MKHYYDFQGLTPEEQTLLECLSRVYDRYVSSVCIFDLEQSLLRFISSPLLRQLQISPDVDTMLGGDFMKSYLENDEYARLHQAQRSALCYLAKCRVMDNSLQLSDYRFSCELQLNIGCLGMIHNYSAVPVLLSPCQGRIRWATISLTPSSYCQAGTTSLRRLGHYAKYMRECSYGVWEERQGYVPSSRELLILQLTVQGHKEQAIAELLGVSMPRLKQIKQDIRSKTHTQCTAQLIARAKEWEII